jgi:hypothetical protein
MRAASKCRKRAIAHGIVTSLERERQTTPENTTNFIMQVDRAVARRMG